MQQADGPTPSDEHRVTEVDVDLVLTAKNARQRLDEDCRVAGARVVETDQVAAFHRPGGHNDMIREPSIEGDADALRRPAQVLVAPYALGAPSTTDVGGDEDQVTEGEPQAHRSAPHLGDPADDLMTGHTANTTHIRRVLALEDAHVRAADAGALHGDADVPRMERRFLNLLD